MTAILILLISVFAARRLTRLIVDDTITQPFRTWLAQHLRQPEFNESGTIQTRPGSQITYLFHCPWCIGLWLSLGLAVLVWFGGLNDAMPEIEWWAGIPALALALSWFAAVTKRFE
jgi:hypothetical protein